MTRPRFRRSHRCPTSWAAGIISGLLLTLGSLNAGLVEPAFAQTSITASQALHKSLVSTIATSAINQRRYRPRRVSRPGDTIVGAPRRGDDFCGTEAIGAFTALAPLSHRGQTTAARPTFAWYIPDRQLVPVSFKLYSASAQSPVFVTEVLSQAGIMSFTLPPQQPGLQPGRYRWQIERVCFPKRLEAIVEFEVVQPPANLEEHWYDALASVLNSSGALDDRRQTVSLLNDLQVIEAAAATQIPKWRAILTKQSNSLKQIIDIEQKRPPSQSR